MQKYTEIPSSTTLADSLPLILQNDKTAISNFSGNAFPTVSTWVGMTCYREDQKKFYQLVDTTAGTAGWKVIADLSGDARLLDGGAGNTINYDKRDLNSWVDMPTGFYQGSNMLHAPMGDTTWRVIQIREGNSDGYASQMAFSVNTDRVCFRKQIGGAWSNWQIAWSGEAKKVVPGLNADMVDGKEPGNEAGNIPVNNGKLNANLNADKVDGYDVGNESGKVPVSNGVLNAGLNADQLDGKHAGNASGNIPINNGTLNKNLNAEMLSGIKINNLLQINNSGGIDRTIESVKINNLNVTNFDQHRYTASTQGERTAIISGVKGTIDQTSSSGGGELSSTTYTFSTKPGVEAGDYTMYNIIQRLINLSHSHATAKGTVYSNCNCRCNQSDCCQTDDNCSE